MPKNKAFTKKRNNMTLTLLASLFIVLTTPLVIWGLTNITSLDTRSDAANNTPKCIVRFLYVDPNFLEINKAVSLDTTVNIDSNITNIKVWANEGTETGLTTNSTILFDKNYSGNITQAYERFKYSPSKLGNYTVYGTLTTTSTNYPCLLSGGASATAKIVAKNEEPVFISAIPPILENAIKVGDQYNYTISAEDVDSQAGFGYYYAFTPNTNWLKPKATKTNQGTGTKLDISLQGVADYPASYLVSAFIWDGYNGHTKSQSWVINVDQNENDIPIVTVSEPKEGAKFSKNSIIPVSWSVKDFNMISRYKLYISANPGNENSWIKINDNIAYDVGQYLVEMSKLKVTDGEYYFLIQAVDNQKPAAIGNGLSGKFVYGNGIYSGNDDTPGTDDNGGSDDGIQIKEPQIINLSPSDKSTVKNKKTIIKATLISGEGAEIVKSSIKFLLNEKDITKELKISDISKTKFEILYAPAEDLPEGANNIKISFTDSKENKAEKSWIFTVEKTQEAMIKIFGYEIPTKTFVTGVLIGLGILIAVIVIPWLFYAAFKSNKKDEYEIYPTFTPQTQPNVAKNVMYNSSNTDYYGSKTVAPIIKPTEVPVLDATKTTVSNIASDSTSDLQNNNYKNLSASNSTSANGTYTATTTEVTPTTALPVYATAPILTTIVKPTENPYVEPVRDSITEPVREPVTETHPMNADSMQIQTENNVQESPEVDFTKYPWTLPSNEVTTEATETTVKTENTSINNIPDEFKSESENVIATTPVNTSVDPYKSVYTQNVVDPIIIETAEVAPQITTSTELIPENTEETKTTNIQTEEKIIEEEIDPAFYYRHFTDPVPVEAEIVNPDNPSAFATNFPTISENFKPVEIQTDQLNIINKTDSIAEHTKLNNIPVETVETMNKEEYSEIHDTQDDEEFEANEDDPLLASLNNIADQLTNQEEENAVPNIYDKAANDAQGNKSSSTTASTITTTESQTVTQATAKPLVTSKEANLAQSLGYTPEAITVDVDPQTGPIVTEIEDTDDIAPPTKIF